MSTFYGGDQLVGAFAVTKSSSGTAGNTNLVIYTVPAGHYAFFSFMGASNWLSISSNIFNGAASSGFLAIIETAPNVLESIAHPFAGTPNSYGADEGSQLRMSSNSTTSVTAKWFVHLYKKP